MLIYLLFLSLLYQFQVLFLGRGLLKKIEPAKHSTNILSAPAILIVHRNDLEVLKQTLEVLQRCNQSYKNWPIYLLDDHSSIDVQKALEPLSRDYSLNFYRSKAAAGKKKALAWLLPQMKEEYIIQIDADCILSPQYLKAMAESLALNPEMVIGQVRMEAQENIWSRLAALDHLSLQLVTFSALAQNKVIMAAGASMAYHRTSFLEYLQVGADWSGGEDTFIAQSMARSGKTVLAQPEALVETAAPPNFKSLIRQRLRWGAKSVAYPGGLARFLAASVALINVSILAILLISPWWQVPNFLWTFWLYKIVTDALLLFRYTQLYGGSHLLKGYLALALLYPLYISLVVVLIPFAPRGKWLSSS